MTLFIFIFFVLLFVYLMEWVCEFLPARASICLLLEDVWAYLADGKYFIAISEVVELWDEMILDQALGHRVLIESFLCVLG